MEGLIFIAVIIWLTTWAKPKREKTEPNNLVVIRTDGLLITTTLLIGQRVELEGVGACSIAGFMDAQFVLVQCGETQYKADKDELLYRVQDIYDNAVSTEVVEVEQSQQAQWN